MIALNPNEVRFNLIGLVAKEDIWRFLDDNSHFKTIEISSLNQNKIDNFKL